MIIKPKVRGFICVTAHPEGCAANVRSQIRYVKERGPLKGMPRRVLVVGASTGYGLASRIAAAFGGNAATLGVFFEKEPERIKTGSAGWYNSAAFEAAAHDAGLYAKSINGDAFSNEIKRQVVDTIRLDLGQVDALVYSLASPRRTHPETGEVFKSVLKPIGAPYTNKTVDTDSGAVSDITIEPASEEEIAATVNVMGGEDWEMWVKALDSAGLLARNFTTVAYSYIGPSVTWPIYRNGTIGRAKEDLEVAARRIIEAIKYRDGRAFVSINKALVTQASSAIPVVPLYISMLYKIMKEARLHEGCIEQIERLYAQHLFNGASPQLDEKGRIRIDDWEMRPEIQNAVEEIWPQVKTENLSELTDIAGYREEFLKLFGFGFNGVDYEAETDPVVAASFASQ
jgi:enoyl-[acyl-carrier protein] reductase/trans-2-enoyl-CoA reductase (NAD+)